MPTDNSIVCNPFEKPLQDRDSSEASSSRVKASGLLLAARPTVWGAVVSLMVLATGEMIQAPRYYEYISRLTPAGQQGTYMGFAFLPIGIGSLIGGWLGGGVLHHFGEVAHQPAQAWWVITAVGVLTALLLWIYDRIVKPGQATTQTSS